MKILHVTNRLSEGGVETFLKLFLPELKKNGHEIDLLVLDKDEVKLKKTFELNGINVFVSKWSGCYNPLHFFYIIYLAWRYDLIHSHLFPSQYYVAMAAVFLRKKSITTEHCTTNKRRCGLFRLIEHVMYCFYDKIVGVSHAASKNLCEWIPSVENKVSTIYNGIDFERIKNIEPMSRQRLGIDSNIIVLCMTARFFEQKDHDTLIRSLIYLPDNVHAIFLGSGVRLNLCRDLAKKLGMAKRCHFLGSRNDVISIVKLSDVCVLSTHYEGMPLSIIEYMASGKPVIATNVDGVREMLDDEFLNTREDPCDLASKILKLINNAERTQCIGESNRERAKDYDIIEMTKKYDLIYKELTIKYD